MYTIYRKMPKNITFTEFLQLKEFMIFADGYVLTIQKKRYTHGKAYYRITRVSTGDYEDYPARFSEASYISDFLAKQRAKESINWIN